MIFVETKCCKLTRDIAQDGVLTFRGETWLEEPIQGVEVKGAAPRG
jgi:hypothetical protein